MCSSAGAFYGRRGRINARELWEQMNTCSCLNLTLACIVYWQAREISWVLSQRNPVANSCADIKKPHFRVPTDRHGSITSLAELV